MPEPASVSDELRKLAELNTGGYLADNEFAAQKEGLLAASQDGELAPEDLSADELGKLADLVRDGVLTREEFEVLKVRLLWSFEDNEESDLTYDARHTAALLLAGGAVAMTVALFPAYYEGGTGLSASAENLGYNIPIIVGMVLAVGLLLWRKGWPAGAGVATAVVLVEIAYLVPDVGAVLTGQSRWGTGFLLGCVADVLAAGGAFLALGELVWTEEPHLQSGLFAAVWSLLSLVPGIAWAVGYSLPDAGYHLHLVSSTFKATRTASLTYSCCNAFTRQPAVDVGQSVALIVLAVGLPVLAACLRWRGFGRGLLLGSAIALSAEWFSSLPARSELAPADFGWTAAKAAQFGFTASWFWTTGFVVLSFGVLGLLLIALTRLLLRR
jgi:hypothetical protein